MEHIRIIREIMEHGKNTVWREVGNALYFAFPNGNIAKVYACGGGIYGETHGITVDIVNKTEGTVDKAYFPFKNYFAPVKCSKNAPLWYQHLVRGEWYFKQYAHVLPTEADFERIADAVCDYIELFA